MMRILHIINNLNMGGGQNLLSDLATKQRELGNDITVLQLQNSSDLTIVNKIEGAGIKVLTLSRKCSIYNPVLIFFLFPIIRKFDIVHVHLFPALYWVGFANLLLFKKNNIVYTEHSTNNRRRGNPILRMVDAFVYKYCYNKIIACSNKAKETFSRSYPGVVHICAINNGIDTAKYKDAVPYTRRELLDISEECFVITMVARFMPMKHQDTIVEAISKLSPKFHVCLVGGEPSDEGLIKVKTLAEKLHVSNRVHFLYIRPDVDRILKTSDVIIMSSEYEGLSLSSIEGMAAGKPFIATRVDGLREVVEGAGLLFELSDSNRLAEILNMLATDKLLYSEVANRCLSRAFKYDISVTVDQYTNEYVKVISRNECKKSKRYI